MVTKKDFKAIAEIIADVHYEFSSCDGNYYNAGQFDAASKTARQLADYFATQNPRFDRQKFLNACGL